MTPRCVVFDVDDTLYLERDYVRSGFGAIDELVRRDFGIEGFAARAWALFLEGVRGDTFNQVLASLGIPADEGLIGRLVEHYRNHTPDIHLMTDARLCLGTLSPLTAMAAITDGPRPSQRAKVAALGLGQWMDPIVVTSELGDGQGKPHPAAYQLVESRSQLKGRDCVYVADNPNKDFVAPRLLGWRTVRIRRNQGLHCQAPSGADVDTEIKSLDELPGVLGFG